MRSIYPRESVLLKNYDSSEVEYIKAQQNLLKETSYTISILLGNTDAVATFFHSGLQFQLVRNLCGECDYDLWVLLNEIHPNTLSLFAHEANDLVRAANKEAKNGAGVLSINPMELAPCGYEHQPMEELQSENPNIVISSTQSFMTDDKADMCAMQRLWRGTGLQSFFYHRPKDIGKKLCATSAQLQKFSGDTNVSIFRHEEQGSLMRDISRKFFNLKLLLKKKQK